MNRARKFGTPVLLLLILSLFSPYFPAEALHDNSVLYDQFEIRNRIEVAMNDVKPQFALPTVSCDLRLDDDFGCSSSKEEGDKTWKSFGFYGLATFGCAGCTRQGHLLDHQQSYLQDMVGLMPSSPRYRDTTKFGSHNVVIASNAKDGLITTQIAWGDPSLFALFFGQLEAKNFASLEKKEQDAIISKTHSTAIEYAKKFEAALVGEEAYDFLYVSPKKLPIIFLPGVAGTVLSNGATELWPATFSYRSRLPLQLDGNGVASKAANITVGSILRSGVKTNFYGDIINSLTKIGYEEGKNLFTFPYDWRIDNTAQFSKLDKTVDDALKKSNASKAILIAHSMGGLVSRGYILSSSGRASKIDSLISIGTPYWGSPKVYYALVMGYNFGNGFVDVNQMKFMEQSWPAAYQLLPRAPFITDSRTSTQVALPQSYSEIRYKGLRMEGEKFVETESNVLGPDLRFVDLANQFYAPMGDRDQPKPFPSSVKHYVIIGTGVQTLTSYVMREAKPGEKSLQFSGKNVVLEPRFGDGDGTVPLWALRISTATSTYYVQHSKGNSSAHGSLPDNGKVQELVGKIVQGKPPGTYQYGYSRARDLTQIKETTGLFFGTIDFILHSDAHLSIVDQQTGERLGYNALGGIEESLGAGTFLSMDGVEYASISDISRPFKIFVNGTREGEFSLIVNLTSPERSLVFSYPGVKVKNGTVSQVTISPSQITATATPSLPALMVNTNGQITNVEARRESIIETKPTNQPGLPNGLSGNLLPAGIREQLLPVLEPLQPVSVATGISAEIILLLAVILLLIAVISIGRRSKKKSSAN